MSFVARLAESLKVMDRRLWPDHRVELNLELIQILKSHQLMVADVGSADGPGEIWQSLKGFVHFLTFEPNPRPGQTNADRNTTNFPIGLWSTKASMPLFLSGNPDSASLMKVNAAFFAAYLMKEGMEEVGATTVEVDTLDHVLVGRPEMLPDFIKIDVEGADLEVLKGARQALQETLLGMRVETSFNELHVGAPLFGEVDAFLREQGFTLFHLGRYHWIRNNGLHGHSSEPQLIWGDGIYFLRRDVFLNRLSRTNDVERRKIMLTKFAVLLLRHGIHDYAWEIIAVAGDAGLVPANFIDGWKAAVKKSMDVSLWYFIKAVVGVGFAGAVLLVSFPLAGARQRGIFYFKQRSGRLFYDLWRLAVRGGATQTTHIADPFV